jgi:hypothetical protein
MKAAWFVTGVLASALVTAAAQEKTADDQWEPLFNGKDTSGWEHVGDGRFSIEDGLLKTEGGMGLLWFTKKKIGHAVVRVVYRTPEKSDNAGVFIRIPEKPTEPWMPVNKGFEVQIDESGDENHSTGTLYSLTKALARPGEAGDWNTLEITLDGKKTLVSLNGVPVTTYTDGQPVPPKKLWHEPDRGPRPDEGFIGLQNHGANDTVYFKEISVRPLP